jgi:hypothetical protein
MTTPIACMVEKIEETVTITETETNNRCDFGLRLQ